MDYNFLKTENCKINHEYTYKHTLTHTYIHAYIYSISNSLKPNSLAHILDDFSEPCDKLPVCSADAGSDSPDQKMWNKQDTKTLFDIRSKKEKEFNSNKVHKSLWENIAKELSALGVKATAVQCMNKWKALKREYKKTVDNNAQTGSEKNTCPFF